MARHDVLPDYPRPGSHDMVRRVVDCYEYAGLVSHLSLSGCQAVAWPEDLWGTACGMGLGWPSIISRACALAAHAITTQLPNTASLIAYGMPVVLPNLGIRHYAPPRYGPERDCHRRLCSNRSRSAGRQSRRSAGSSISFHSTRLGGRTTEVGE